MGIPVGWPFLLERTPGADVCDAGLFAVHVACRVDCGVTWMLELDAEWGNEDK